MEAFSIERKAKVLKFTFTVINIHTITNHGKAKDKFRNVFVYLLKIRKLNLSLGKHSGPLSSTSTFGSNYSFESFWVNLYKLFTSGFE